MRAFLFFKHLWYQVAMDGVHGESSPVPSRHEASKSSKGFMVAKVAEEHTVGRETAEREGDAEMKLCVNMYQRHSGIGVKS